MGFGLTEDPEEPEAAAAASGANWGAAVQAPWLGSLGRAQTSPCFRGLSDEPGRDVRRLHRTLCLTQALHGTGSSHCGSRGTITEALAKRTLCPLTSSSSDNDHDGGTLHGL